ITMGPDPITSTDLMDGSLGMARSARRLASSQGGSPGPIPVPSAMALALPPEPPSRAPPRYARQRRSRADLAVLAHQLHEVGEQVVAVVRAGAGLRVVLHGHHRQLAAAGGLRPGGGGGGG